ncbi:MAG: flagellar biosynthesis protein FlhF [Woeseiaceae bacterium]
MKIKRFLAPTMREALKAVRIEQGPDAVILSNQRVGEYIEIIAALDYDEALINQTMRRSRAAPSTGTVNTDEASVEASPDVNDDTTDAVPEIVSGVRSLLAEADRGEALSETHRLQDTHVTGIELTATSGGNLDDIRDEIGSLKSLMQDQMGALRWQDKVNQDPDGAQMRRNLTRLGIADDVASDLCATITPDLSVQGHTWRQPISALSRTIPVTAERLLTQGGVAAFVGPTGVGKTTSIAKIASQYAVAHGARDIALISMDCYRIGAQEQLRTFGRIINASVFEAANAHELSLLLEQLKDYQLILIDTEGVSQRDARLLETLDGLSNQKRPVELYLTLAATVDESLLDEIVMQYSQVDLAGIVLTKIDEASRLGAPMSVAIRHALPLVYLADGQHVPDDIAAAEKRRLWLLNKALEYAKSDRFLPYERDMARRYMMTEQAHA